jgi:hypothetical protein
MASRSAPAKAQTVEEATAEAGEYVALVDALEERIRSGDASVSADDLTKARQMADFATLQAEAAQRRAEEARRTAATQAVDDAVDDAQALVAEGTREVEDLRTAAATAFAAYADAVDGLAWRASEVRAAVVRANDEADAAGVETCLAKGMWLTSDTLDVGSSKLSAAIPRPLDSVRAVLTDAGFMVRGDIPVNESPVQRKRPWPPRG